MKYLQSKMIDLMSIGWMAELRKEFTGMKKDESTAIKIKTKLKHLVFSSMKDHFPELTQDEMEQFFSDYAKHVSFR